MKRPFQRIAGRLRDQFEDCGVSQMSVFHESALIGRGVATRAADPRRSGESERLVDRPAIDDLLRQARCANTQELGALAPRLVEIADEVVDDILVANLRDWVPRGRREDALVDPLIDAILAIAGALVRRNEHLEEALSAIAMGFGGPPLWRLAAANVVASILRDAGLDRDVLDRMLKPVLFDLWQHSPDVLIVQAIAPAFFAEPAVVIARCKPFLRERYLLTRQAAVSILSELGTQADGKEAKETLAAHLPHEESLMLRVRAAAGALGHLKEEVLVSLTEEALSAEAPSIRLAALALTGALPVETRTQLVGAALQEEPDPCLQHCMRQVIRPQ